MIFIESKDNPLFKDIKKLKERRGRNKSGKYIIEGFRLIEEAIKAKVDMEYIFVTKEAADKMYEYLPKDVEDRVKVMALSEGLIKELSSTEKPQGIIAVIKIKKEEINLGGSFYLLCDKLQDPGNLGTIIRTAHAAGVDGIILTKGTVDIFNDKVIRATMGSMFHIPILIDEDLSITRKLIDNGFSLLATSLEGDKDFFMEDLKGKIIISVGNEGNGVSDEVYSLADKKVKIPMPGGAESLNVAIATSIILYEKVRQNKLKF